MAISGLAVAAHQGILIRRKLEENTTDKYKIETKLKQTISMPNGMGDQDMDINSVSSYAVKVGKVDAATGVADVEVTTKVEKMDMTGPMAAMADNEDIKKPFTLKGKMDVRNRITMEAAKSSDMMAAMMMGSQSSSNNSTFIELPEKAVSVGDSWEVIVPKGPLTGKEDQKLTAKLVGEKDVDGVSVWVVSLTGLIKTDADLSKLADQAGGAAAGQKMTIKGTVDLTAEGLVDKGNGRTIKMTSKAKMKQTVELVDMGMSVDTKGTVDSVVTLQK